MIDGALREGILKTAKSLGVSPVDLATVISYETAGTFDPAKKGPTTQWGQHKGLIQFGEPQAKEYGVDWNDPVGSQLGEDGAVAKYMKNAGVKPGMGLLDMYSAVNAGHVGLYNRTDENNGGAPGTVREKVQNQMSGHRKNAEAIFRGDAKVPATMKTTRQGLTLEQMKQIRAEKYGQAQQATPAISLEQMKEIRAKKFGETKSEYAEMGAGEVAMRGLKNLPKSIAQELGAVVDAITNPVDTAKAIGELGKGMIRIAGLQDNQPERRAENPVSGVLDSLSSLTDPIVKAVLPDEDGSSEDAARTVGQYYVDQYGSIEGFKKAVAENPASVLSDVAGVVSGGAGIAAKGGVKAAGVAGKVNKAAGYLDPVNVIGGGATRVVSGKTLDGAKRLLQKEGVTLSPGQLFDGATRGLEEKATSIPLLGDAIKSGYTKTLKEFNTAAYNRVLKPLGLDAKKLKLGVGPDAVDKMYDVLGKSYDRVLPKLKIRVTDDLVDGVAAITSRTIADLPDETASQVQRIVENNVERHLYSNDVLDGETLKRIETDLNKVRGRFSKSGGSSDQIITEAIDDIKSLLRDKQLENNPKYAEQLKKINEGYANFTVIRRAMSSAGDKSNGFTPAQLKSAVRGQDTSVAKGRTARGKALMQDLADAGVEVLPSQIPDSGTAGRTIAAAMAGGAIVVEPLTAALIALGSSPYVARKIANGVIAKRPGAIERAGKILKAAPKYTGPAISEVAQTKETVEGVRP